MDSKAGPTHPKPRAARAPTTSSYAPVDAARSLIWLAEQAGEELDNLRLQKLLYYVQAWSLAIRGGRMLDEDVRAFEHGPVFHTVYTKFKRGKDPIPTSEGKPSITGADLAFIAAIWDDYKRFSTQELMDLVHNKEPLWRRHYRPFDGYAPSPVIPDAEITEFFRARLGEPIASKELKEFVAQHHPPAAWTEELSPFSS